MENYNEYTFTVQSFGDDADPDDIGYGKRKEVTFSFACSDVAQWTTVLREFLLFLGATYGYDVSAKVDYPNKDE